MGVLSVCYWAILLGPGHAVCSGVTGHSALLRGRGRGPCRRPCHLHHRGWWCQLRTKGVQQGIAAVHCILITTPRACCEACQQKPLAHCRYHGVQQCCPCKGAQRAMQETELPSVSGGLAAAVTVILYGDHGEQQLQSPQQPAEGA